MRITPAYADLAYPFACSLRRVSAAGHIHWAQHQIYLSVLLEDQDVALRPLGDGLHEIFFGPLLPGWMDEPSATFTPCRTPPRSQKIARPPQAGAPPLPPRDLSRSRQS